ncbi:MAG: hypothetical protein K6G40_07775 [Eubacterium sp.]|nr:hypothetical protein [Eubacterium sp.]
MEKKRYFIEGNTVRKTAPAKEYPEIRRQRLAKERIARERQNRERKLRAAQRNQERALYMNPAYVAFLSVCVVMLCVVCGVYINLQSDISSHIDSIAAIENDIISVKSANDEALNAIETSLDLDTVKYKAMNDLGMVYPKASQIVYYSVDESDSMTQYSSLPSDK